MADLRELSKPFRGETTEWKRFILFKTAFYSAYDFVKIQDYCR